MHRIFPASVFSIVIFAFTAGLAQSPVAYSESRPYTPRVALVVKGKPDSNKKKDDVAKALTVSVPATIATFPVSVLTNAGTIVSGLQRSDFRAFVDDAEVEILSVETKSDPLNVVLVLDMSPSTAAQINFFKGLASRIVDHLRPQDKVMVVSFNADTKFHLEPTTDRKLIAKALGGLNYGDGTSIYKAITELHEKRLSSMSGTTAIVLISDGVDTTSRKATYESSLRAVEDGNSIVFPIYFDTFTSSQKYSDNMARQFGLYLPPGAFGVSKEQFELGRYYLTDILQLSGGRTVITEDILSGRSKSLDDIPAELVARYHVTVKLPAPRGQGERHAIKFRVNGPNLKILAKGSYLEK